MRRPLALLAAVIAIAAAPAGAREPYDFDLTLLGAPRAAIWVAAGATPADAALLAGDARVRFARLASDLALGLSSSLLQPASTTGHSGWAFDMEAATTPISPGVIGTTSLGGFSPRGYWPTGSAQPHDLLTPSLHVRKAFPFSTELGGRVIYLSQSSYFAAQLEGKVALVEGFELIPDVALRAAWTRLLGQRDLDLSTTELDLMVSRRFGMNAVISLTPYLAARYTMLSASTRALAFGVDTAGAPATPAAIAASSAAFPKVSSGLYRTTLGLRMTSMAVSMAAEATYFGGASEGKSGASDTEYPSYKIPSSIAGAFKFGFEF